MQLFGFLALGVFAIFAVWRHRWLLLTYTASLGWVPYKAGRDVLGPVDMDDFILLGVCVLGFPRLLNAGFRPGRLGKFAVAYWLISLAANALTWFAFPGLGAIIIRQMLKDFAVMTFILIIESALREKSFVPQLAWALLVAGIGAAFTTLVDYWFPSSPLSQMWQEYTKLAITGGIQRYGGILAETYMAGSLMMPILATSLVVLLFGKQMNKYRPFALAAIPLVLIAVLAGQSRSTYIAIMVVLLLAFVKPRYLPLGIAFVVIIYYTISASPELNERFFGRWARTTSGVGGRMDLWIHYLQHAPLRVFILGEGFAGMSMRDFAGHMSYMEVFADAGFIGLILFVSLWYHILTARKRIDYAAETRGQWVIGKASIWIAISFMISSAGIGLIVNNTYRLVFTLWMAIVLAPVWEYGNTKRAEPTLNYKLPEYERRRRTYNNSISC